MRVRAVGMTACVTATRCCSHRRGGCLRCVDQQDAEEPSGDEASVTDQSVSNTDQPASVTNCVAPADDGPVYYSIYGKNYGLGASRGVAKGWLRQGD
ncbi:hypothetical protein PF010_g14954 [Phytophthora fragariae]|uniref:Uncharacterized protein n=1 Tax=Phytophthora fragariae TaxID=53985 RepID=A0A6A3RMQ9_9STRA|nr:hypothetical protein PF003_g7363 [Phytophthora fragariae]KAE9001140.1 hypothetical protein PF011_g13882 [Phytophthora fragariae]KAE9099879.1 hypothetical protein PF007_g15716 [Phytophthora fragariae]KAE9100055.1 hypothetical protein PF010_g14954 [Phytophthora fragariae]KAE9215321.1 hypothetical protein PF004_g14793 [Phytophthora fragariae]